MFARILKHASAPRSVSSLSSFASLPSSPLSTQLIRQPSRAARLFSTHAPVMTVPVTIARSERVAHFEQDGKSFSTAAQAGKKADITEQDRTRATSFSQPLSFFSFLFSLVHLHPFGIGMPGRQPWTGIHEVSLEASKRGGEDTGSDLAIPSDSPPQPQRSRVPRI